MPNRSFGFDWEARKLLIAGIELGIEEAIAGVVLLGFVLMFPQLRKVIK